jgi:hypothetical protein
MDPLGLNSCETLPLSIEISCLSMPSYHFRCSGWFHTDSHHRRHPAVKYFTGFIAIEIYIQLKAYYVSFRQIIPKSILHRLLYHVQLFNETFLYSTHTAHCPDKYVFMFCSASYTLLQHQALFFICIGP